MTVPAQLLEFGERALLVELGSTADVLHVLRHWNQARPAGVDEMVAGAKTILLIGPSDPGAVADSLSTLPRARSAPAGPIHTIPTSYDGPDLAALAMETGWSESDLVQAHTESEFLVAFMGFSPGFAYLSGGDPRLDVPRRSTPRTSVPAGSVAIAAGMTAVYPQATPGGWALIGRTDTVMFDPDRAQPALLAPGDRVRFRRVDAAGTRSGRSLATPVPRPAPGEPAIEILEPGPLLTIQDGGRYGWRHVGVPVAGAADRRSAARANRLVGNPAGQALLESTLGSCRIRLMADRRVAVTGAIADVTVDGLPARAGVALDLRPGTEIRIGPCRAGVRIYIAVSGGLDVPPVLGSRSTDTLSGLGPAPLHAGQAVAIGPTAPGVFPDQSREVPPHDASPTVPTVPNVPTSDGTIVVKAQPGPRQGWLSNTGRQTLENGDLQVAPSSDRTGVRLMGAVVERSMTGEIPSEGMVAGAIQIPPSGEPIVLMRNHPATGGYPVVAVVTDEGVDALAQAPPGTKVRFDLSC